MSAAAPAPPASAARPGPPAPPAAPPTLPQTTPEQQGQATAAGGVALAFASLTGIASFLFYIMFSYGAAKLSYDKYGSMGWAVVNFIFATFYYPYYAIFLNGPSGSSFGGRRRR
jgi:hypothetical protein